MIETPRLSSSISLAVAIRRAGVNGCFISSMNMPALIGQTILPACTPQRRKCSNLRSAAPVPISSSASRKMIQKHASR